MSQTINRIRTQIDFRPTRGHTEAALIYTALMHYNRGGNTDMTASQLITRAFIEYDPSEIADVTRMIDACNTARYFSALFNITQKDDIKRVIESETITPVVNCTLLEPDKKFVCFDADDNNVKKLWGTLDAIRFRDRGCLINTWLYQYFAHGNSDYYNKLCASRLLDWLKGEYEFLTDKSATKIEVIAKFIWDNSPQSNEKTTEKKDPYDAKKDDKLRVLMGIGEKSEEVTF